MLANWYLFDSNDPRISALGNDAFGAYCRAARWCVENGRSHVPEQFAIAIAPVVTWQRLHDTNLISMVSSSAQFEIHVHAANPLAVEPAPKKKRAPRADHPIPSDFALTPELRQYAEDYGVRNVEKIFEDFRLWYGSKDSARFSKWNLVWYRWVRTHCERYGIVKPEPVKQQRPAQRSLAEVSASVEPPDRKHRMIDDGESFFDKMARHAK